MEHGQGVNAYILVCANMHAFTNEWKIQIQWSMCHLCAQPCAVAKRSAAHLAPWLKVVCVAACLSSSFPVQGKTQGKGTIILSIVLSCVCAMMLGCIDKVPAVLCVFNNL